MKAILSLAIVLVCGSAHAIDSITCRGNEDFGTSKKISLTLSAVDLTTNDVSEGTEVPYKFVVKNGKEIWAQGVARAAQEDVIFGFESNSAQYGKLVGRIYLDELEQSALHLNGQSYTLDCR